jgi:GntR family transcriptional regulator
MLDNQPDEISNISITPINHRSLTEEIVERITDAIETEQLMPGQKLPSEPKFADQLGVSRNTLREAINILVENDLLYRSRGVGTFVSKKVPIKLVTDMEKVVSTTDVIKNQGCIPGVEDFSYKLIPANTLLAQKLNIAQKEHLLIISRTRTANGIPVTRSNEHIPLFINELILDQLINVSKNKNWSLYELLKSAGYAPSYEVSRIRAIIAEGDLAKKMGVPEGDPLLCFEQTHFSIKRNEPILYCVNYHNHKIIEPIFIRKV